VKGLFEDSGIPVYEKFRTKINMLNEPKCKTLIDGKIVFLPKQGKAFFIGDLHGDFEALISIGKQTNFLVAMDLCENEFLVFLGDYGDRGAKILETINEVITLKLLYPENVVLLRGNHEEEEMAEAYGTYDVFVRSYGREKVEYLFKLYCATMTSLPIVAIAPNGIIGVHGGIPNRQINSIKVLNGNLGESYAREMTWNDPDEQISGWRFNSRGGSTKMFGEDAFDDFMKAVPANVMVRSHQYPSEGVKLFFKNRLATIFSNGSERSVSSAYSDYVRSPVFLETDLSRKKDRFEQSDFIKVLY